MPYIGSEPSSGLFQELDSLTASATDDYTLKLNGADYFPETVNNLLVSINGVIQGGSTMALNGAVLTVGATLSSSDTIDFVRVFGNVGTVSTPTDGSVTANKIGTGAVNLTSKVSGVLPIANGGTGVSIANPYMHVRDEKSVGTNAGNSVSGINVRVLNTVVTNTIAGASLASNRITLPEGTYRFYGSTPSLRSGQNKSYLYNVNTSALAIAGTSEYSATADTIQVRSHIMGRLTISSNTAFEFRLDLNDAKSGDGLGIANGGNGLAGVEVYTVLEIFKEG